ncbi:hypothetical protein M8818_003695 [Zalaria obscura]|uniref:Uncharacterized protein n=1 Tax=Zalaria obscura TaxID=2024903 RepID=A0ACC3SER0_9PEZI
MYSRLRPHGLTPKRSKASLPPRTLLGMRQPWVMLCLMYWLPVIVRCSSIMQLPVQIRLKTLYGITSVNRTLGFMKLSPGPVWHFITRLVRSSCELRAVKHPASASIETWQLETAWLPDFPTGLSMKTTPPHLNQAGGCSPFLYDWAHDRVSNAQHQPIVIHGPPSRSPRESVPDPVTARTRSCRQPWVS